MVRLSIKMCFWLWSRNSFKIVLFIAIVILVLILNKSHNIEEMDNPLLFEEDFQKDPSLSHIILVHEYLETRKDLGTLSVLGNTMFLHEKYPIIDVETRYKILIWKIGKYMETRHMRYFTKKKHNPFEDCSVNNCDFTYKDEDLDNADAVLFSLHRFSQKGYDLPDFTKPRPPYQRWIFMTDEGQNHTFMHQPNHWYNYSGVFNWSMSYKAASDVPVPCGRTMPLDDEINLPTSLTLIGQLDSIIPFWEFKQRNVLMTNVMSYCASQGRVAYLKELEKYINVDAYGKCGHKDLNKVCPFKGYGKMCPKIKTYVFYLAFHNCNCDEFIDEKVWTNGYMMGNIPIIMGSRKSVCEKLLPLNSFIHVDDFESPEDLAKFIINFNNTFEESLMKYHSWRKNFYIEQESGYAGTRSRHYCRLCEALNYNDPAPKIYDVEMLRPFLDPNTNCYLDRWNRNKNS